MMMKKKATVRKERRIRKKLKNQMKGK